jgi:phage tail sheath protein FI
MTVTSLGDWVSRLNGTTYGGVTGQGPTGGWKTDWYSAYNYLTYGGALNIAESATTFFDTSILLDSVFTSTLTQSQATAVENTVSDRGDVIGIIGVTYAGYTAGATVPSGVTSSFTLAADSNIFAVGGEKVMLGLSNSTVGENFVTIPLASDAAGCFARTDRDANPWFSPAGTRRGRILNTVRLIKNPKNLEQDYLYTAKINSVIGVPGQGTFLFGDITQEGTASSSLTRVNVVRLINYIKKVLGNTARTVLFEVNDSTTRSLFKNAASGFLQSIKEGRGLFNYRVVCDETNNTAELIDANQFIADVYIQPTKSINYVKITITNLNTSVEL